MSFPPYENSNGRIVWMYISCLGMALFNSTYFRIKVKESFILQINKRVLMNKLKKTSLLCFFYYFLRVSRS